MRATSKKIVISGGLGFQGTFLIQYLLQHRYQVTAINIPTAEAKRRVHTLQTLGNLQVVWNTVNAKSLEKACANAQYFFHFANGLPLGNPAVRKSIHLPVKNIKKLQFQRQCAPYKNQLIRSMVRRELPIIKSLLRLTNIHTLFISSAAVYAQHPYGSISESAPIRPRNLYGFAKVVLENMYTSMLKSQVTIIRPFNIFGPFQRSKRLGSFIIDTIRQAAKNETIYINGDGQQKRDPMYIEDTIRAYVHLMKLKNLPRVINLGSGITLSINQIVSAIRKGTHSQSMIEHRQMNHDGSFYSNVNLLHALGFRNKYSLLQGIEKVLISEGL